jgi:hypothetical protein
MGLHSGGKVIRLCLRFFILSKLWILVVDIWHFMNEFSLIIGKGSSLAYLFCKL